jgi:hypothetical protein
VLPASKSLCLLNGSEKIEILLHRRAISLFWGKSFVDNEFGLGLGCILIALPNFLCKSTNWHIRGFFFGMDLSFLQSFELRVGQSETWLHYFVL